MPTINISYRDSIAIIQLNRPKANAISQYMMNELREAVTDLENDEKVQGGILTGVPPFFSAGLDLKELVVVDRDEAQIFFSTLDELIFDLLNFSKPLIAAITGHAPAGGCLLSLCCDFRIMGEGEKFQIGLNEVPVGIMIPPHIYELYAFWIGKRNAYQFMLQGKLLNSLEALKVGLVDEVVPLEMVVEIASQKVKKLINLDQTTLRGVKKNLRQDLISNMRNLKNSNHIDVQNHFWLPSSQQTMRNLLAKISK